MEKQLFTWEEVDFVDYDTFIFVDVALVRDIGPYPKGTRFDTASINFETGKLRFFTGDAKVATFDLTLDIKG